MEVFRRYGFDKPLAGATLGLMILGIVMVFSASGVMSGDKYHQTFYFFINQVLGAAIGLGLVFCLISVRQAFFENRLVVYGLLALSLGLLVLCFLMPSIAHTNRWVQFSGVRFQPSELSKISLVLFLSYYFEQKREKIGLIKTLILPAGILLVVILLILKEPDFGTALLIFTVCSLMFFLAGARLRDLSVLGLIFSVLFALFLFSSRYRRDRLIGFMSPEKDPLGQAFQVNQAKLAVGSGGLLGVGLGFSTQKLYFLPCAHTDFIYAIIGEELGLLGTVVTLALFLVFLWRGLRICLRAPTFATHLLAGGLTLVFGLQALLNISVALGIGPPKGVPLPFISFGRSSLICNSLAVGLLLNISQRKKLSGEQR